MHPKVPVIEEDERTYSTSLSSAILPSMDLTEMLSMTQPEDKVDPKTELIWSWQDRLDCNTYGSQSDYLVNMGSQANEALLVTSPRQRHGFPRDIDSFAASAGRSPTLPVFHSSHPPSPGCDKKTRNSKRSLQTFAYLRSFSFTSGDKLGSRLSNSQWLWILLYFSFNLLLTLSNKSVLTSFPFPYTLTSLHTLCSTVGCYVLRSTGFYVSKPLTFRNELVLGAFSVLYAINIVVSNVSLQLVTVPFHQVVRAATPIFTIMLSIILLNVRTKRIKIIGLSPVIIGVIVATYGDYYFTLWGFLLTLFGTFLAALKTIYTNVLQSSVQAANYRGSMRYSGRAFRWKKLSVPPSLGIHPLDLLMRMSPLAFIQCILYAQLSGELDRIRQLSHPQVHSFGSSASVLGPRNHTVHGHCIRHHTPESNLVANLDLARQTMALLLNGCIAFGLNVVSLTANGKIGALSMTVAANVKQVLTILFAVILFDLTITPANALGITITLLGGAGYAWGEYLEKQKGIQAKRDTASGEKFTRE
ncbi:TPT-domain-containing protein [Cristinia sonorae]|uniref:TPT-domain-containing protein n=1 Tax=Cristinia sonorae TaxID=1940300 RepID=A0A8K0UN47_9AGAR|nr:TPT-domain-containing protein [Cristinia sonorae]